MSREAPVALPVRYWLQSGSLMAATATTDLVSTVPLYVRAEEYDALRKRLEIDGTPYDGIATRDETIRLLEKELAAARLSLSEASSKIDTLHESMRLDAETIAAKDAKIAALEADIENLHYDLKEAT